ncbi:hypothetical protein BDN70DRAFT_887418 [Pholiota conissans]|uniref:DUF6534 domain-containing protein n=1 Tax=Pholiota conissans TaxID=109636 RepID=A0A9P5YLM2_9AGAR|nr:hypothetical protein BDN70DRAFT_887418 [Pholiota conissans]
MSASALPPVAPPDLSPISGPLLVGYILNWGLHGILSMQVYLYYLAFPRDRVGHKALVYGTYLLESAQTFLFTSSAFKTFAMGFGNPAILDNVDTLWFSMFIMSGLIAFITQTFYAYRVSILGQSIYAAIVITVLAFVQLGGALTLGVQTKQIGSFSHFWDTGSFISAGIWEGSSTACDLIIAAAMLYYFTRRESNVKDHSNVFITRVLNFTIESGAATALVAIATLVLTFLPSRPTYYQACVCVLGKVYSNSMLVAFNSRMRIASLNASTTAHEVPIPLSVSYSTARSVTNENGVQLRHSGLVITREEVSFSSPNYRGDDLDIKNIPRHYEESMIKPEDTAESEAKVFRVY